MESKLKMEISTDLVKTVDLTVNFKGKEFKSRALCNLKEDMFSLEDGVKVAFEKLHIPSVFDRATSDKKESSNKEESSKGFVQKIEANDYIEFPWDEKTKATGVVVFSNIKCHRVLVKHITLNRQSGPTVVVRPASVVIKDNIIKVLTHTPISFPMEVGTRIRFYLEGAVYFGTIIKTKDGVDCVAYRDKAFSKTKWRFLPFEVLCSDDYIVLERNAETKMPSWGVLTLPENHSVKVGEILLRTEATPHRVESCRNCAFRNGLTFKDLNCNSVDCENVIWKIEKE